MSAQLLTVPETAERLSVGRATVYRYVADGLLDRVEMPGRVKGKCDMRIPEESVDRFIAAHLKRGRHAA